MFWLQLKTDWQITYELYWLQNAVGSDAAEQWTNSAVQHW